MNRASFNAGEPLAFFLTWTTYGTWLPGDERGWNGRKECGIQEPNPSLVEMAQARKKEADFRLSPADRQIVEDTIRKHCEIRKWGLHAVNVRSNHVHVVVTALHCHPETVRDQLKAWCTRKLKEVHKTRVRFWSEGGSQRWVNTESELAAVIEYVLVAQDR